MHQIEYPMDTRHLKHTVYPSEVIVLICLIIFLIRKPQNFIFSMIDTSSYWHTIYIE